MDEKLNPYDNDDEHLRPVTPRRRESESSTERSQYALEDEMKKSSSSQVKTYGFYRTKCHIKVCDEQKNVIYYCDFSEFSSAPDVALHQGVDKHAPLVAVARFRWSIHLKLGVGKPNTSEHDMIWEDMKNVSRGLGHSKYCFEMNINNERRRFMWQRTRDPADGVEGVGKIMSWNYRLVDEGTGEILAVYLENFLKSWKKKGKLQLKADLGKDWELMVLVGSLGLCEKASRRARRIALATSSGGGGGGGE